MTKLVALVGMCGAGKSVVADEFVKAGYEYVRFGQPILDEVKRRGVFENTEPVEREVRIELRKQYGMAAMATLNIPRFDELLEKGNVIADGLYSWSEYKVLKERYSDRLVVVGLYAPPAIRYARLSGRANDVEEDPTLRYRSFTEEEAKTRDYAEIENIEKGGPIAMADFMIKNDSTVEVLHAQIQDVLRVLG